MTIRRLALLLISTIALGALPGEVIWSYASSNTEVKNCVNLKTGKARIVSAATSKCKLGEKLVFLVIPVPNSIELSIVHYGSTPPIDFTIGHDGDFYVDTATSRIYGPRSLGMWGSPINLVGPQGAAGITGAVGEVGPMGPQGLKGETGTVGSAGPQGLKGETGTVGAAGPTGPQGPTGATGATGATGPTGPSGAQGIQGIQGVKGDPGGFGYYGSFYDTGTVALTANQARAIPLRVTDFANGILIENDTQNVLSMIRFQYAGKYNISFSLQLTKSDAGTDVTSIWICQGNGSGTCNNVPWTSTDVYLIGNSDRQVAAWNFFVSASANDFVQLMISPGTSTGTSILANGSQSNPTRPEVPSTILTVNQVG